MQVTFLTTDEVADLIELSESLGTLTVMQETVSEIIYRIQGDDTGEQVLIHTAFGNYLITQGA
jgi:hypothetical protein